MPRRTDLDETTEETTYAPMEDLFDQEIDDGELEALEAEVEAEAEARKAPEGHYLTIVPYVFAEKFTDIKVVDEEGNEEEVRRPRYSFWDDAVQEDNSEERRFKLGFDLSPMKLYVVFNGTGNAPTYYRTKVNGAQLDQASKNVSKAGKLYEKATGRPAKRYKEIAVFLQETQLRLTVKKFKSGKSGVVGFEIAK